MLELLAVHKRACLRDDGIVTPADFDVAWQRCWMVMVDERAWPHATDDRRHWRTGMRLARHEYRAAFLNLPAGMKWIDLRALVEGEDASSSAVAKTFSMPASRGRAAEFVA